MNQRRKLKKESVEKIDVKTVMDVEDKKIVRNASIVKTKEVMGDLEF